MDQKEMVKQMIDFQKSSFDNSFNAMKMVQEQTEKIAGTFVDQTNWIPEDGRKLITQWINAYTKGRDDFKKVVDDNFEKVDEYFSKIDNSK
jgi:polyhydroxyalkanoate synthesis regulator phasin